MSHKRMDIAFLPDDLIEARIIPHLSLESIGRFRCVSKSWKSRLSSPQFIKHHLKVHTNDPEYIFLTYLGYCVYSFNLKIKNIEDYLYDNTRTRLYLGPSCHGLVLVTMLNVIRGRHYNVSRILINPVTRDKLDLPDIATHDPRHCNCGLGYDSLSDDYKIVSILPESVDVYCVKRKTQRSILMPEWFYISSESDHGVFVDGYLYWTCADMKNRECDVIVAFDLAREEFEQVPLPRHIGCKYSLRVTVLEGCLALVVFRSRDEREYSIWVMKEKCSWIKVSEFHLDSHSGVYLQEISLSPSSYINGEVHEQSRLRLFISNWEKHWSDLGFQIPSPCFGMGRFRGSLVSPNFRED